MCIYYKDDENLTYSSEEHVIPAGVGGMRKLPKGYVCDQFNNGISKLEQRFLRDSILAMPRIFVGPGKRGSLSESKATKSKIQFIKNPNGQVPYSLGYTVLGKTTEIPTLLINTKDGSCSFSLDKKENAYPFTVITDYKTKCLTDGWLKIKIKDNSELPTDTILIGVKEGIEENYNCFVLRNPENTLEISAERIRAIANGINFEKKEPEHLKYMPHVQDTGDFDSEYFRVHGKIAFNTLALLKGKDFLMSPHFDEVRKWIAYGGDNNFASMLNSPNALQKSGLPVPKDAHSVLISRSGQMVIANVSLYNHFIIQILLSNSFSGQLSLDGFICDWVGKKEYAWHEYLVKILPHIASD
jgi:hypothetical protein